MDYYNNYYEELYHAGFFSALRGRIRDGHKWLTRTGTPGHYVYTYAKDLAGKASGLFTRRRATASAMAPKNTYKDSTSKRSSTTTWKSSAREDAAEGKRDDRFIDRTAKGLAKRDANTGRATGKMTEGFGDGSVAYQNEKGLRSSRKYAVYDSYEKDGVKKVSRHDNNSLRVNSDGKLRGANRDYELPSTSTSTKKSAADRIKEWGGNTLSSIRKTASNAGKAIQDIPKNSWKAELALKNTYDDAKTGVRKGFDKAVNNTTKWLNSFQSDNRNSETARNNRTSRTTYNEYSDARRKEAAVESAKNHRNSVVSTGKGASTGLATASSASSSSSTSSSNRPRGREKNVTNSKDTAVSVTSGRRTDVNGVAPTHNRPKPTTNTVTVSNQSDERKKRRRTR